MTFEKLGFIEVKTTDNQSVALHVNSIIAIEVVPASVRVDGHIKVFVSSFKWQVQEDPEKFLQRLGAIKFAK